MGMIFTLACGRGTNKWLEFEGVWTFEQASKLMELFDDSGAYVGWTASLENANEDLWFAKKDEHNEFVWVASGEF